MPTLRERLKRPETYLIVLLVGLLAVAVDAARPADRQLSARAYVGLVEIYQAHISPNLGSFVRCRYRPTCSEYSRQAVQRFGLFQGLLLSVKRVASCTPSVPLGTPDPVPSR